MAFIGLTKALIYPRLLVWFAIVALLIAPIRATARQVLLVSKSDGTVGEYDAVTGATINASLITGITPLFGEIAMTADRSNHVFVADQGSSLRAASVGEYDAATGAPINASFVTGFRSPNAVAVDTQNHLFVRSGHNSTLVGEYDATTGSPINPNLIQSSSWSRPIAVDGQNRLFAVGGTEPLSVNRISTFDANNGTALNIDFVPYTSALNAPLAILLDGNNHLLVANRDSNTISQYDATTGALLNPAFINGQGLYEPVGMTLDGNNHLFVTSWNNIIGEYDATTGATINAAFISGQGLANPSRIVFISSVPEPSSLLLLAAATGAAAIRPGRQPRRGGTT
jgi:hypothetical protein